MGDYFTHDRSRLGGQPKRVIGGNVEFYGFPVPRRFSLEEAIGANVQIIARSEHDQDYDGACDLLQSSLFMDSHELSRFSSMDELKTYCFTESQKNLGRKLENYCRLTGYDFEKFKSELSFSLWERIYGLNVTVIADSSIPGRHHIMSNGAYKKDYYLEYSTYQDATKIFTTGTTSDLDEISPKIITRYEQIRALPIFDKNHCPIMEFQVGNEEIYFLQYHRCRDFVPRQFQIESEPKGYTKALFIRGATPPEGMAVAVLWAYADSSQNSADERPLILEEGCRDDHNRAAYAEASYRKRWLQLGDDDFKTTLKQAVSGHAPRSMIFKPGIFFSLPDEALVSHEEHRAAVEARRESNADFRIIAHVISDGEEGYIKRIL